MSQRSLQDFIGYGSVQPLVVFLGIEEKDAGGGACALQVRARFDAVEDVKRACAMLAECAAFVDPFAPGGLRTVPQWNMASRFRLALAGLRWQADWDHHWRNHLGRSGGDTLLAECFTEPAAGMHVVRQRHAQWPGRRQVLGGFARTIEPCFVVAYGGDPGRYVEEIFPVVASTLDDRQARWHPLATQRPASIGRTQAGTVVARVGFFGQGQFALDDLDGIALAMTRLGDGPIALRHGWP